MTLEEDIRSEENIRKEDVAKRFRHVSFPKFTNLTLYTSEVVDEFEVLQGPHVYDFLARRVRCDKCGKPTGFDCAVDCIDCGKYILSFKHHCSLGICSDCSEIRKGKLGRKYPSLLYHYNR